MSRVIEYVEQSFIRHGSNTPKENAQLFIKKMSKTATIHEYKDVVFILEKIEQGYLVWMMFHHFTKSVLKGMEKFSEYLNFDNVYAKTEDIRIKNRLLKLNFKFISNENKEYILRKDK